MYSQLSGHSKWYLLFFSIYLSIIYYIYYIIILLYILIYTDHVPGNIIPIPSVYNFPLLLFYFFSYACTNILMRYLFFFAKYMSQICASINRKIQVQYRKVLYRWIRNLFSWSIIYIN